MDTDSINIYVEYNKERVLLLEVLKYIKPGESISGLPNIKMCPLIIKHLHSIRDTRFVYTVFGDNNTMCLLARDRE